jgi:hypothetical protein
MKSRIFDDLYVTVEANLFPLFYILFNFDRYTFHYVFITIAHFDRDRWQSKPVCLLSGDIFTFLNIHSIANEMKERVRIYRKI